MNLHLIDVIAVIFFLTGILFSLKKTLFEVMLNLFQSLLAFLIAFHYCQLTTFKIVESGLVKEHSLLPFSFLAIGFSVYIILTLFSLLLKLIVEVKFISVIEHTFRYVLNGIHFLVMFLFIFVFYLLFPNPFLRTSLEENQSISYKIASTYLNECYFHTVQFLPRIEPTWTAENPWISYVDSHYPTDKEKPEIIESIKSNLEKALSKITD